MHIHNMHTHKKTCKSAFTYTKHKTSRCARMYACKPRFVAPIWGAMSIPYWHARIYPIQYGTTLYRHKVNRPFSHAQPWYHLKLEQYISLQYETEQNQSVSLDEGYFALSATSNLGMLLVPYQYYIVHQSLGIMSQYNKL